MKTNAKEIFDFLKELTVNNDREWFHAHKAEYDELREAWILDVQRLIGMMAEYDATLKGVQASDCVYRIYRDIRFTKDKTPYKTYFSTVVARGGRKTLKSCYYLHMQPGDAGLHGGIWCPDRELLSKLRHSIDDNIEEFLGIINGKEFTKRYRFVSESLKTMPKGFPREHPYAEYIKMKEYLVSHNVPDSYFTTGDWVEKAAADFRPLMEFHNFLNYTFDE